MGEVRDAFPHLKEELDLRPIHVKAGSKLRNLIPAAINQYKSDKGLTVMVGNGVAAGKVVSLSELVKRRLNNKVNQYNNIQFTTTEEMWCPKGNEENSQLEPLK